MAANTNDSGLTLTVLGCGTMGIAILSGILDSLSSTSQSSVQTQDLPSKLPTKFNACVRSSKSASRIRNELSAYDVPVTIYENDNLPAVQGADIVLLGCKPYMVNDLLSSQPMRDALKGKLLLSICAGVPVEQIEKALYPDQNHEEILKAGGALVVRAMPNTASKVREGMTVIATSTPPLEDTQRQLVEWIFSRIGRTVTLPASNMDAATALCGSGPAFMALVLEAMADGAVAMGLPRAEAQMMAAQTMRGTTGLVLDGEHPAVLKDKVSTPGGCTIGGLMVLEERGLRGTVSRAVREATVVASQLGQGVQGVSGTRF
ncbi:Pyrroline-5-carboxylate reductase [Sphaceloma murrayae]|uniref:Pyrroline-5-carboxylate reductase n=1 Tax=Sphaceloma murrayae TaxID=2082308 RepID=A0A2K1QMN1_9PEZI|nr:Pyrroline-5-carboxylate reductase [Sphaceloma murrayae]